MSELLPHEIGSCWLNATSNLKTVSLCVKLHMVHQLLVSTGSYTLGITAFVDSWQRAANELIVPLDKPIDCFLPYAAKSGFYPCVLSTGEKMQGIQGAAGRMKCKIPRWAFIPRNSSQQKAERVSSARSKKVAGKAAATTSTWAWLYLATMFSVWGMLLWRASISWSTCLDTTAAPGLAWPGRLIRGETESELENLESNALSGKGATPVESLI